jgi:hypothetical protein
MLAPMTKPTALTVQVSIDSSVSSEKFAFSTKIEMAG